VGPHPQVARLENPMRAICEACAKPQPLDWKAGDLCAHCGQAVRHDVRCFWCAKWVPAARFCRACGAETVPESRYGAARMLKDAGVDRFAVPKKLAELDVEQIDNFTRIYQRQAVVVARQVDDLRFVEGFLRQRPWSGVVEDQLIPQLPWSDEALAAFTIAPLPVGDDLTILRAIQATSPLAITRELAALARLRLDDWDARRDAVACLHSGDGGVRAEAALALSSWRVRTVWGELGDRRTLVDELRASPLPEIAAVRLAAMSRDEVELPAIVIASTDPEVAFTVALIVGDVDRLTTALGGDDVERVAAGRALAQRGVTAPLGQALAAGPDWVRNEILRAIVSAKRPVPHLAGVLLDLVEGSDDEHLRERAARVLCLTAPASPLRIAKAARGDRSIFQSLLQAPGMAPEAMMEVCAFLVANGHFTMNQYGISTVAEQSLVPPTCVPALFSAADDQTRQELCRFAEAQLGHAEDEDLHRFLIQVVYGDHPAKVRSAAWWSLHRWYRHAGEHRGEGPFRLERTAVERFFGSMACFLPKLTAVLSDRASLKEVGLFDHLANLLGYHDEGIAPVIIAEEAAAYELIRALLTVVEERDYYAFLRSGAVKLLGRIHHHPRWRDEVVTRLHSFSAEGEMKYDVRRALGEGDA